MNDCLFCNITAKKIPADIVFEDDKLCVFKDIHPKARIHLLMIPKEHIDNLMFLRSEHNELMAHMMLIIPTLTKTLGLENGFRTVINTGKGGGQEIDHLHFHLLGGGPLKHF